MEHTPLTTLNKIKGMISILSGRIRTYSPATLVQWSGPMASAPAYSTNSPKRVPRTNAAMIVQFSHPCFMDERVRVSALVRVVVGFNPQEEPWTSQPTPIVFMSPNLAKLN